MDPRSGGAVNPTDVVRAFVTRINAHDNDGLRRVARLLRQRADQGEDEGRWHTAIEQKGSDVLAASIGETGFEPATPWSRNAESLFTPLSMGSQNFQLPANVQGG